MRVRFAIVPFAMIAALSGCGEPKVTVPEGNESGAREALVSVLEAWKGNKTRDELKAQSPPVWVADEDWEAGRTLASYEIDGEPELNGSHWRVYTKLTISDEGKTLPEQQVCYAVTLGDNVSVIRSDFLH